jgi:hypothetical protein
VHVVRILGEVGAARVPAKPFNERRSDPERRRDTFEVVRSSSIDVDPQELALLEPPGQPGLEVDSAIAPVGVVQLGADGAARDRARSAQRTTASNVTTTIAMTAIPYWRTSMARSARAGRRNRDSSNDDSPTTGLIIDATSSVAVIAGTAAWFAAWGRCESAASGLDHPARTRAHGAGIAVA